MTTLAVAPQSAAHPVQNCIVAGLGGGVVFAMIMGMMGMPNMVLTVGPDQWTSLMGHVIFGLVTGLLFARISRS